MDLKNLRSEADKALGGEKRRRGAQGKWGEQKVRQVLKALQEEREVFFNRLKDSRSALGFKGPGSPGDFWVVANGRAMIIETKSSANHQTLRSGLRSLVKRSQIAACHLMLRAKGLYVFLHFDLRSHEFELWHGRDVLNGWNKSARLEDHMVLGRFSVKNRRPVLEELILERTVNGIPVR